MLSWIRTSGQVPRWTMCAASSVRPRAAVLDVYPNFGPRNGFYYTERHFLAGNKAILTFDDTSVLMSIDWVSE